MPRIALRDVVRSLLVAAGTLAGATLAAHELDPYAAADELAARLAEHPPRG